jgi:hypothetical protein
VRAVRFATRVTAISGRAVQIAKPAASERWRAVRIPCPMARFSERVVRIAKRIARNGLALSAKEVPESRDRFSAPQGPLVPSRQRRYAPDQRFRDWREPVNHEEYERRKRAIEEQLLADLELVRAAAQTKLRALEQLWLASPAQGLRDIRRETPASAETRTETLTPAPPETLASSRQAETPTSPPQQAIRRDVLNDILDTFPQLPEVFDKSDVVRLLGYEPSRPSLHRAWDRLLGERKIVMDLHSDGRRPTRWRKVVPE